MLKRGGPQNNELQLTSGAEKLGRRSQLNSVFDAHESLPAWPKR
jgi:hypothetical protein